ncbi:MAG: hypothetical protein OQK11_08150, partial [Thiovulaceae bacterium]|nr:hypothetical protein [Sulfurimonadaceae bacterium]
MKTKIILSFLILIVILWNGVLSYIDQNIQKKYDHSIYNSIHKIWVARGLYNSPIEENSITAVQRAFDAGASGVEVDFYYDIKSNKFIVSHNKPRVGKNGELIYEQKDGKTLTLEELFLTTGKDHYFYLDYKNLDRISYDETKKAIKRLEKITQFDNLKSRVYIEGSHPLKLSKYTQAGFKTLFGIHPLPEDYLFSSIVVNGYKIAYYFSDITAIALNYGTIQKPIYGEKTQLLLKHIPIFVFHTPSEENFLKMLIEKEDVKMILPGVNNISTDRTYITASEK